MNYHRKQWEREKRNPIAKKLREHKPKVIPNKKHNQPLRPNQIDKYIEQLDND